MLLLTNDDVAKVFDLPTCLAGMEAGYRDLAEGEVVYGRTELHAPSAREDGFFVFSTMHGAIRRLGMMTLRLKSDVYYWPGDRTTEEKFCIEPGTFFGLIMLVSTQNGAPLALMHDGYIQHMRMATSASLGVKHLARADAHTVGVIGSGGMAQTFVPAISTVRDIRRVVVYSPTVSNREAYAQSMSARLGIPVTPVATAEAAVREADILALCTDATKPVLDAEWVRPGTHVITVRLEESPGVFERSDIALRLGWGQPAPQVSGPGNRLSLYLGDAEFYGSFPREGTGQKGPALVQMEDLVSGRFPGRTDDHQISYNIAEGTQPIQITAAAAAVYQRAQELGVGSALPLDWFTQKIRD